jgi:hypothetical protein
VEILRHLVARARGGASELVGVGCVPSPPYPFFRSVHRHTDKAGKAGKALVTGVNCGVH